MSGIVFGLVGLLVGGGVGFVFGHRRGVRASWLAAAAAFLALDRLVFRQLRQAEESARLATEREHELIHAPRPWGNGAGYRSPRFSDSPARTGVGQPKEINEDTKAG